MHEVILKTGGAVLLEHCWLVTSFFRRFLGLMGRKTLSSEEGLFFPNCNSIHTWFMRFPIDVVLVDKQGQVVEVIESLKAWRLLFPKKRVKHTLELRANRSRELGIVPGMILKWE